MLSFPGIMDIIWTVIVYKVVVTLNWKKKIGAIDGQDLGNQLMSMTSFSIVFL